MIRANIETEIAPIVGNEQQAQDILRYIQRGERAGRRSLGDQHFRENHRGTCDGRHAAQDGR